MGVARAVEWIDCRTLWFRDCSGSGCYQLGQNARELTIAVNREYALPLNNPDTVSAEHATHLKETDLVIGLSIYGEAQGLSMVDHEQLSCGQRYLQDG